MLISLNGLFWDKPFTGSGMYLRQLWRHMPELPGAERYLLLRPGGPHDPAPERPNARAIDAGRYNSGPSAERPRQVWWEQIGLPDLAGNLRADLLHSPYLAAPLFRPAGKLVVTVHDLIPWVLPEYRASGPMRIYLALAGFAARRADLLLA